MSDRITWGGKQRELFKDVMRYDLQRVLDDRKSQEARWKDYLTLYRVPKPGPDGWTCDFPFEGAPAYTMPVARMSVDPTKAKYIQSLHATPNIWSLTPLNERWVQVVKPLQDYLQWIDWNMLDMWDVNNRVVSEMLKLGTGIYKTGWSFSRANVTGYDSNMRNTKMVREINQPVVDHVHLTNFLVPPEALHIQADKQGGARWIAERWRPRPSVLRQQAKGQEPFLPNFDPTATANILKFQESSSPDLERHIGELDGNNVESMLRERPIELWEIWARFDTTGDGVEDDIVVLFHYPTREILRATYNPYAHGKRPYHAIRYKRGDGFYGIGLCERAEMWQRMQSDLLNADIAASMLRNAPMWDVPEGANFLPGDPVFPGRVVTRRPGEEGAKPLFMVGGQPGDIRSLISFTDNSARQDTGVTDLNSGMMSSVPSRTPATTVQSLLQEAQTHIDMSLKDARNGGLSQVGMQVLQNVQQQVGNVVNNPNGKAYVELAAWVLGEPEGRYVAQALQLPFEKIEQGVGVELTATSSANNKELSKQNILALVQIVNQNAPLMIQAAQIAQQMAGSPMGMVATKWLQGNTELMTRLMEQFDVRNPEQIIPDVSQAIDALVGAQPPGGGGFGGTSAFAPSPLGQPGMAGV